MKRISKYINSTTFFILILVILCLSSIIFSPSMGIVDTYKKVDGHYLDNPIVDEQVQFDGEYVGRTSSYSEDNVVYYMPPILYDVLEVDGRYVFLSDEYFTNNLSGSIGKTVHVEGAFKTWDMMSQKINGTYIEGHIFNADKVELVE